jgi:hypothetical protein|tara:strand:- start:30 stop:356 length:327 start_codon:yes stop_codon:yes gene_type:complete
MKKTHNQVMMMALDALVQNNHEWKSLADSGDVGTWKAEEQSHYLHTADVIATLREALARPESRPLMGYAIMQECRDIAANSSSIEFSSLNWFTAGVVFSERAHGITKT